MDFESPILVLFTFATSTVHTTYINSQNTTFSFKYVDFCPQIFLIFENFCWMLRTQPISLLKLFLYPSLANFTTHITINALLIQNQEEFLTRGINFIASEARFLQEAY